MSEYKNEEYDFVKRTSEILYQYEEYAKEILKDSRKKEKYDVTLLLNSCVGLLLLPRQLWFNKLPKDLLGDGKWGIKDSHISLMGKDGKESKNVRNLVCHLRNSVSHLRIFDEIVTDKNGDIEKITFKDCLPDDVTQTFEATISINDLKVFLQKLSTEMLKIMKRA